MIIAIDGPSGSGKTTLAKEIAKRCGFSMLDTGAMYRAVTYLGLQDGLDLNSFEDLDSDPKAKDVHDAVVKIANEKPIEFSYDKDGVVSSVFIDGQDVTTQIRTTEVDATVSLVSSCKEVREALVARQRELAQGADTVLEGRDIGTVVFPNADLKIFLTANVEKRAQRRALQNKDRQVGSADVEENLKDIKRRDNFDSSRVVSPLTKAEDAIELDTTDMTLDEVVEKVVSMIEEKMDRQ